MEAKPKDFFIGVFEFFAVLLPGGILAYLLLYMLHGHLGWFLRLMDKSQQWIAFGVAAYVLGHLLEVPGQILDWAYGWLYKGKRTSNPQLAEVKQRVGNAAYIENYYSWANSFLIAANASAAAEIARLQSSSKFFRSLVIVLLVALLPLWAHPFWLCFVITGVAAALYRFMSLRWRATRQVYEYYLLFKTDKQLAKLVQTTKGGDADEP